MRDKSIDQEKVRTIKRKCYFAKQRTAVAQKSTFLLPSAPEYVSESKAEAFAMDWMNKHPRGVE